MKTKEVVTSCEEIEKVLREGNLGFLGLSDGDVPYVVPLTYIYRDGKIIFHCALTGKKLDYLQANNKVCFTVARQEGTPEQHEKNNACLIHAESVMCFGTARLVEDLTERHALLNEINKYFKPDAEELPFKRTKHCYAVEIAISEMTMRREVNLIRQHWKYTFQVG